MSKRTVQVAVTVVIPMEFDDSWSYEDIEHYLNDSYTCGSQVWEDVEIYAQTQPCLCHAVNAKCVAKRKST